MRRPAIVKIAEEADGSKAKVTITLAWDDGEFHGVAKGSPALTARPRLIGEATLRAVEAVTGGGLRFELEGVATQVLGPIQVALTHIRVDGLRESLVGSAVIDDYDPATATVKAVLDALNRRLERLS